MRNWKEELEKANGDKEIAQICREMIAAGIELEDVLPPNHRMFNIVVRACMKYGLLQ